MCEPVSIGMAAVALIGGTMAAKDKAKAEGQAIDQQRLQQREIIRESNVANANLVLQQQDKHDQARQMLTEVNMTALRNKGTMETAVGESGLTGNSMERLKRMVDNEASAEKVNIQDNYQRDYASLFADQVWNTESTKGALKGMAPVPRRNKVADALNVASSTLGAYTSSGGKFGQGDKKTPKGGKS